MENYSKNIKNYSKDAYKLLQREKQGCLKYPFLVPGAGYAYELWDWDSWLTDIAIRQILLDNKIPADDFLAYERGCSLNFLDHQHASGKIAIELDKERGDHSFVDRKSLHKPCLAQHIAFVVRETNGDTAWIADQMDNLDKYMAYYRTSSLHEETGLYFFGDDAGIGVDNDPNIFYRPHGSTASIYINSFMYKEMQAMEYLHRLTGNAPMAAYYQNAAEELKTNIRRELWDEKCGMYYCADISLRPIDPSDWLHQGKPRHWSSLIMRIDAWPSFLAMWAGIATPEEAERMVKENMFNEKTFFSNNGVRTLSKLEKMYWIGPSGNPSCWLGPIWICANYFCFRGLLKYGYEAEARRVAEATIALVGKDIGECGEMHEYYHPDTGEGVFNQSFQSWNLLVNNMLAYLEGRDTVTEF